MAIRSVQRVGVGRDSRWARSRGIVSDTSTVMQVAYTRALCSVIEM